MSTMPRQPIGGKTKRSEYLAAALQSMQQGQPQIRSGGELAARLLAQVITGRALNKAEGAERAEAQAKEAQRLETIKALFPGDPRAVAAATLDPSGAAGSFFKAQEPMKVGQGETVLSGGKPSFMAPQVLSQGQTLYQPGMGGQQGQAQYTAPQLGVTGAGQGYSVTPQGMTDMGSLAPTQVQDWSHQIDQGQLGVAQQNARANMIGAGAQSQNAGTNRLEYEARLRQGGFGTPGMGNVLGPTLPPGWVPQ